MGKFLYKNIFIIFMLLAVMLFTTEVNAGLYDTAEADWADYGIGGVGQGIGPWVGSTSEKYSTATRYVLQLGMEEGNTTPISGKEVAQNYYIIHYVDKVVDPATNNTISIGTDKSTSYKVYRRFATGTASSTSTYTKSKKYSDFKDKTYAHITDWRPGKWEQGTFGISEKDVILLAQVIKEKAEKLGDTTTLKKVEEIINGTYENVVEIKAEILFYVSPANSTIKSYYSYNEIRYKACVNGQDNSIVSLRTSYLDAYAAQLFEKDSPWTMKNGKINCSCNFLERRNHSMDSLSKVIDNNNKKQTRSDSKVVFDYKWSLSSTGSGAIIFTHNRGYINGVLKMKYVYQTSMKWCPDVFKITNGKIYHNSYYMQRAHDLRVFLPNLCTIAEINGEYYTGYMKNEDGTITGRKFAIKGCSTSVEAKDWKATNTASSNYYKTVGRINSNLFHDNYFNPSQITISEGWDYVFCDVVRPLGNLIVQYQDTLGNQLMESQEQEVFCGEETKIDAPSKIQIYECIGYKVEDGKISDSGAEIKNGTSTNIVLDAVSPNKVVTFVYDVIKIGVPVEINHNCFDTGEKMSPFGEVKQQYDDVMSLIAEIAENTGVSLFR